MTGRVSDQIFLTVNGRSVALPPALAEMPLLWVLRDQLGLKGAKFGCGHGGCGACMVQIDGAAAPSCTTLLSDVGARPIVTIEGLSADPANRVIRAWLEERVPQCGYCQPGMVVAADALIAAKPCPTDQEIDDAMSPVLCRCGTYPRARRAIHRAAHAAPIAAGSPATRARAGECEDDAVRFNPWVAITPDGTVIVSIGQAEMGQGIITALSMLVAEELGVPLDRIVPKFSDEDPVYENPLLHMQITVGSLSIKTNWGRMRRAGAEVRERLIAAASQHWNAAPETCHAQSGEVVHEPTGRCLPFGKLAAAAARLPPVENPRLKSRAEFTLLGTSAPRFDALDHVCGRTKFGLDIDLPGKLVAGVLMSPTFGAEIASVDEESARNAPGVFAVKRISDGVAVVAQDFVSAWRGRQALNVKWRGGADELDTPAVMRQFRQAASREGEAIQSRGEIERALKVADRSFNAEYETPFQAHAPIEPMNCTAWVADGRCDVWVPTQSQTLARRAAAAAAGLPMANVAIHTTNLGGGFGRRSVQDVVTQAVEISKSVGRPVQLLWTRGDDIGHDRYRPAGLAVMRAALGSDGKLTAWFQRVVGPELVGEGLEVVYDIPALRTEHVLEDPGVPTGYWRSVGASQHAFAVECFMDELAAAAACDAIAFRLRHLEQATRHRHVLELAAEKAGWTDTAPEGRARGVALYYAHGGWAAQIAEVSVTSEQRIKVHRVVCAIDCRFIVNPDIARAQIEGAVVFGLTATLKTAITIKDGHAEQTAFRDFPLLTMAETPEIDVHFVDSDEPPSGAGECGVPPVAPAVANAVFALTRQRLRCLPLRLRPCA